MKYDKKTIKKEISILTLVTCYLIGAIFIPINAAAEPTPPEIRATYQIYNVYDLQNMSNDLGGDYVLMNDIDASVTSTWSDIANNSYGFIPIGSSMIGAYYNAFTGTFDGQNYTISNLYINESYIDKYAGLFSYTNGANIMNLILDNVNITQRDIITGSNTGGIVGRNEDTLLIYTHQTNITNCHVSGVLRSKQFCGGIIGLCSGTTIMNCTTNVNIYALYGISGGIAGSLTSELNNIIYNSTSTGNIYVENYGGGIAGSLTGSNNNQNLILECYSNCNVYGTNFAIGGFVGMVTGQKYTNINECYSTGNVYGNEDVGGFVGNMTGGLNPHTITNCYSTGNVTRNTGSSNTDFGGFIGSFTDAIEEHVIMNCYSIGSVIYENDTNPTNSGFTGDIYDAGNYSIINCHWDIETSDQLTSQCNAEGNTTTQMKQEATFIDWDFDDVWYINENVTYPYLQWQGIIPSEEPVIEISISQLILSILMAFMPIIIIITVFNKVFKDWNKEKITL